jgi:hypothetical protein
MLSDDPMSPDQSGGDTNVDANFSNMSVNGDIVNTNTTKCNVNVTLTKASISGAITTGTQEFLGTYPRTPEDRNDIGMVKATYAPTADAFGVKLVINGGGTWMVTETSYLTSLQVKAGGVLDGDVTVNGVPTTIVPGTVYTGAIVVTANRGSERRQRPRSTRSQAAFPGSGRPDYPATSTQGGPVRKPRTGLIPSSCSQSSWV